MLLVACCAPALAHRFYTTLAEAHVDGDRGMIEVALRVDDHNLEDALRLQRGRGYVLNVDGPGEQHVPDGPEFVGAFWSTAGQPWGQRTATL